MHGKVASQEEAKQRIEPLHAIRPGSWHSATTSFADRDDQSPATQNRSQEQQGQAKHRRQHLHPFGQMPGKLWPGHDRQPAVCRRAALPVAGHPLPALTVPPEHQCSDEGEPAQETPEVA